MQKNKVRDLQILFYTFLFTVILFILNTLGIENDYYYTHSSWDIITHTLGGIVVGLFLSYLKLRVSISILIILIIIISWELFEYYIRGLQVFDKGVFWSDTAIDMILGFSFAYLVFRMLKK